MFKLPKLTVNNKCLILRIEDLLDLLQGSKVLSSMNLTSGCYQVWIMLGLENVLMTAFSTPFGHHEFKVLSFLLNNAPTSLQK